MMQNKSEGKDNLTGLLVRVIVMEGGAVLVEPDADAAEGADFCKNEESARSNFCERQSSHTLGAGSEVSPTIPRIRLAVLLIDLGGEGSAALAGGDGVATAVR